MKPKPVVQNAKDVADFGAGRSAIGVQFVDDEVEDVGWDRLEPARASRRISASSTSRISMMFSML